MTVVLTTTEELEALVKRAVEPIREELERLRAERDAEALAPAEAARRLGVSTRTVQRMIRRGELPSVKIGGARRVRIASLLPGEPLPAKAKTG